MRNNRLPEPVIRVKQPALARFSPDIAPLFVHFRADDDVTETIAGNLPNEVEEIDARHDIQKNADGSWTANGHMPLEDPSFLAMLAALVNSGYWFFEG